MSLLREQQLLKYELTAKMELMKKSGFIILAVIVLGVAAYLAIAVLKITIGLIVLAIAAVVLFVLWHMIKHKWEKKFENES